MKLTKIQQTVIIFAVEDRIEKLRHEIELLGDSFPAIASAVQREITDCRIILYELNK